MNLFIYIYILLYILYIILGPHFISRLIRKDDILIVSSIKDLIRRIFYLSYVSLLVNAYYFYKGDLNSWTIAMIVNISTLFGFIIKWYNLRDSDPYYYIGIVSHIILFLPVLIHGLLNLNFKNYKKIKMNQVTITFILLVVYLFVTNMIYKD